MRAAAAARLFWRRRKFQFRPAELIETRWVPNRVQSDDLWADTNRVLIRLTCSNRTSNVPVTPTSV